MSDPLTDDHVKWTQDFTGLALCGAGQSVDPNAGQPNQSVDPNAGQPNQSVDPNAGQPNQSVDPNAGQPNQSVDPNAGQPNQSVDPNAGQPNQSVDPNAGQPNQSVDPNAGQPNQSVDPNAGQPNQSVDPNAGQPNQSVDPNAGQSNQSVDPNAGQPNQSVDPNVSQQGDPDSQNPAASAVLASAMSGSPTGPDPCDSILEQIIELMNEVAQRINDALNDPHNLYRDFRSKPHPDFGSWDGHRDRFYYDRDRLRQKIAEWEADNRCRGRPLKQQEQEELNEANEYKDKEFPEKPAPTMREAPPASDGVTLEKVLKVLAIMGLSLALAATIVAALADPEPATKLGLAGLTVAEVNELLLMLGLAAKAAGS